MVVLLFELERLFRLYIAQSNSLLSYTFALCVSGKSNFDFLLRVTRSPPNNKSRRGGRATFLLLRTTPLLGLQNYFRGKFGCVLLSFSTARPTRERAEFFRRGRKENRSLVTQTCRELLKESTNRTTRHFRPRKGRTQHGSKLSGPIFFEREFIPQRTS